MFIIEQLRESSGSLKTINTLESSKSLHISMIIMKNDNAQRQFVYFIIAICRNTLKSFLSQFL